MNKLIIISPIEPSPLRNRGAQLLRHLLLATGLAVGLLGCAADRMHKQGLDLIDQGQSKEGIAKLKDAVKKDPENLSYRSDLIQKQTLAVQTLLARGDNERAAGHIDAAHGAYNQVLELDPKNARALDGIEKLAMDQRHAASFTQAQALYTKNDLSSAQAILRSILLENPNHEAKRLQRTIDDKIAKDEIAGPTLDAEFKKPVTLQFRDASLKMVVETLSRNNGINILLDKDVRSDLKTTIFVKDASFDDTLDLILLQNQLAKKILSNNTVFIYPATAAKIKDYQDLKIRAFQLNNADAKQMETMLKTVLKIRDMFVNEKTNSLVIRDTPDAVRLAEKLIAAEDLPDPEVMLEVEVLEITRARLTELGIKLPEQIAVSANGTPSTTTTNALPGGGVVTTTTPAVPLTLATVKDINSSYFNVSPISASLDLKRETGDVNILASPRIRVSNREKAKILIGDRVPVITNSVTPVATGTPVVTGTVQYLDVGLKLNVEPNIRLDSDVAIKVNLEVSTIVREVSSGPTLAYQIGTRSAETLLSLKDGETQVLAGLISDEDRKSAQKFPGLGDLPVLGRLFSSHKNDAKKTEIVLSITPHIIRANQRPDIRNIEFWSGTDSSLHSRPLTLQARDDKATATAEVLPAAMVKTNNSATTTPVAAPTTPVSAPAIVPAPQSNTAPIEPAPKATTAPVSLNWQGPTQAVVGKNFQVSVEAQTDQGLGSLSFTLGYNPAVLSLVAIAEGNLLKQGGKKTTFTQKVDPKNGRVFIQVAQKGANGAAAKGGVVTATFTATGATAQSPLVITDTTAVNAKGESIPISLSAPYVVTLAPAP